MTKEARIRVQTVELKQLGPEYLWRAARKMKQLDAESFSEAARRTLQLMRETA